MGLPTLSITFSSLASSAIQRSQRGIVALILRDDTKTTTKYEYTSISDISSSDWTTTNLQYIKDAFLGVPSKVIVIRGETTDTSYSTQLTALGSLRWNWLAIPGITSTDVSAVATQVKTWRVNKKIFKAVLPNHTADHEGIVNFATEDIETENGTFSASQYTARIAGLLAGLSLTRSATYYELSEVTSITESSDPGTDIDAGKLILINDGAKIKIARGVNSLTTTTTSKGPDWKKIKIVEGMDLINYDIRTTFEDSYVGKYNNNYTNQLSFITAVNGYLTGLEPDVLDPDADNSVSVDVESQRTAWTSAGVDVSGLTDDEIKEKAYGSNVYLTGTVKISDAMEDLSLSFTLV